ncbi:MAG: hypothetical protein ACE3L7_07360 [Candidatus Pristimantibacillus sp.]
MKRRRILSLAEQLLWINQLICECAVQIEVVALDKEDDQRFMGMHEGTLKTFSATASCNASYTWLSATGSIRDDGHADRLTEHMILEVEVGDGQMELELL